MRKIPIYNHPAAGWQALKASADKLRDYHAMGRGSFSVFRSNQPDGGFDCPGCAWPDHINHKTVDVCETGIKVLASETTTERADAKFFSKHTVTELQGWNGYEIEHAGRLTQPMRYDAKTDRYVAVSWDKALRIVADKIKSLDNPDEGMYYTAGRVTNEPAFLYQLMVRCLGTNNMPDCSNMCHEPTSVTLSRQIGVGKASVIPEDYEKAELMLLFGQNPATNHPRMLEMLAFARDQGCDLISINPMREQGLYKFRNPQRPVQMLAGASKDMVSEVVQIRIGGDAALITGLAKWLIDNDKIDNNFIKEHTAHYEELLEWLNKQSWEDIERGSGISKEDIVTLARRVGKSRATICTWGMGITQHVQGDDNVAMVTNLLLLMGMIGVEGAGASPIRGHSNVQGDRTMGIHERPKKALLDSLESVFGIKMPRESGYDVVNGCKALIDGKLKVFMSMAGNLSMAAPEKKKIQKALTSNELNVFVATKLNETMIHPGEENIILPCISRTEKIVTGHGDQFCTIEDSCCQIVRSNGRLEPISKDVKAESQIIADLAVLLFGEDHSIPWATMAKDYNVIRDYVAQAIDGFENFNQRIRENPRGFHLYHPARYRIWDTESGKAEFIVPKYPITYGMSEPQVKTSSDELWQLASVRSHDQFNTMIFGYNDRYRQTMRRDVLFMHPDEVSRLGWRYGDRVMVHREDSQGNIRSLGPLVLTDMDISAGSVAMYYPESNDLIDLDTHTPESRTPAYKSLQVKLERVEKAAAA